MATKAKTQQQQQQSGTKRKAKDQPEEKAPKKPRSPVVQPQAQPQPPVPVQRAPILPTQQAARSPARTPIKPVLAPPPKHEEPEPEQEDETQATQEEDTEMKTEEQEQAPQENGDGDGKDASEENLAGDGDATMLTEGAEDSAVAATTTGEEEQQQQPFDDAVVVDAIKQAEIDAAVQFFAADDEQANSSSSSSSASAPAEVKPAVPPPQQQPKPQQPPPQGDKKHDTSKERQLVKSGGPTGGAMVPYDPNQGKACLYKAMLASKMFHFWRHVIHHLTPAVSYGDKMQVLLGFLDERNIDEKTGQPQFTQRVSFTFLSCLTGLSKLGTYGDLKCEHNNNTGNKFASSDLLAAKYLLFARSIPPEMLEYMGMKRDDPNEFRAMEKTLLHLQELLNEKYGKDPLWQATVNKQSKYTQLIKTDQEPHYLTAKTNVWKKKGIKELEEEKKAILENAKRRLGLPPDTDEKKVKVNVFLDEPPHPNPSRWKDLAKKVPNDNKDAFDPQDLHFAPYNRRITQADVSQDRQLAPFVGMRSHRWGRLVLLDDGNEAIPIQAHDMGKDRSGNFQPMCYPDVFEVTVTLCLHPAKGPVHGAVFYIEKIRHLVQAPPQLRANCDDRANDEGKVQASGFTPVAAIPVNLQSKFAAMLKRRIANGESLLTAPPSTDEMPALMAPATVPALMPPSSSNSSAHENGVTDMTDA